MEKRKARVTKVTVFLPHSMELTKLKARNALEIQVRSQDELLGTLFMGRGSVVWWPGGNKIHSFKKSWRAFAEMLDRYMR